MDCKKRGRYIKQEYKFAFTRSFDLFNMEKEREAGPFRRKSCDTKEFGGKLNKLERINKNISIGFERNISQ